MHTGSAKRKKKRGRLWPVIVLLVVVDLAVVIYGIRQLPRPNRNALALGEITGLSGSLDIEIHLPTELDEKSKAEVFELREEAVYRYPDLISGDYAPSDAVFGQIKDHLPWWGVQGQFYFGSGERSIEGPAEESRFILNPYLLVAAEFYGLSIWSRGDLWDRARTTEEILGQVGFPLYCRPARLRWWARESRAQVTYDVSLYLDDVNRWTIQPLCVADASFDLVAYNARDLNLNYIYLSFQDSRNLAMKEPPVGPVVIRHFIHQGGSCGYPDGCNNMSPHTPELSGIQIKQLPARATIWLWAQEPESVEQSPDMIFVIHFE